MRKFLLACVTACFAASGTTALAAEENDAVDNFFASIGTFDASVTGTTDYTFRGVSQTSGDPAIQGSFGWSKDFKAGQQDIGLYASAWGSNVEFEDGDNAHIEIDYTGGITTTVAGVTLDAFGIYYARLLAGAVLTGLPVALIYLIFQRRVTQAITLSAGIKG